MASPARKVLHDAWWSQDDSQAHASVTARLQFLSQQNTAQREDVMFHMNIFSNFNIDGEGTIGALAYLMPGSTKKIRRNIASAAVDTAASMIAAGRTMPLYLTSGADFQLARRAEQRGRVLHGQFYELGVFDIGTDVFFDGAATGTGIVKGYRDTMNRPQLKRLLPNSVFVDQAEGRDPRSFYEVGVFAREVLMSTYPKCRLELESSAGPTNEDMADFFIRVDNKADLVRVVEAWHLPSVEGAKDGRHVICANNVTLLDEPYERDRPPLAFYRYAQRRAGFWGQGLIERTLPAQLRQAELQRVVDACQDLCSLSMWLIPENSNFNIEDIDNLPGGAATYQGQVPPQLVTWSGTPPDIKAEIQQIADEVFANEGLSPGMVGGELPQKGLNSARAVRAADDVASRRLVIPTRAFERFYLDVARLIEDLNDDCAKEDPDYAVTGRKRFGRKTFLNVVKWTDLALPTDDFRCSMFPMSAMPTTPQGKIATVDEWIQDGFVSKPQAMDLMEFPDTESFASMETADIDLVMWQIDETLEWDPEGEEDAPLPIPNQDLMYAAATMNKAFLVAYRMKAPQHTLDAMQSYIDYAKRLMDEAAGPVETNTDDPAALSPGAAAAAQVALQQGAPQMEAGMM